MDLSGKSIKGRRSLIKSEFSSGRIWVCISVKEQKRQWCTVQNSNTSKYFFLKRGFMFTFGNYLPVVFGNQNGCYQNKNRPWICWRYEEWNLEVFVMMKMIPHHDFGIWGLKYFQKLHKNVELFSSIVRQLILTVMNLLALDVESRIIVVFGFAEFCIKIGNGPQWSSIAWTIISKTLSVRFTLRLIIYCKIYI